MRLSKVQLELMTKAAQAIIDDKELMQDVVNQALTPEDERDQDITIDLINKLWFNKIEE